MSQTYYSGGLGITKFNGIDYNVTNAEFTEEVTEVETTTTANYDATEQMLYKDRQGVKRAADGTADLLWDSQNQPMPLIRAGSMLPLTINFPNGKQASFPLVLVKSIPVKTGGMDGLYNIQIAWGNKGKYSWL